MIRSMIARGLAAMALLSAAVSPLAAQTASSITVKDGAGTSQSLGTGTAGGKLFYGFFGAAADGSVYTLASALTQGQMRGDTQALAGTVGTPAAPAASTQTIVPLLPQLTATDIGGTFGTTAAQLVAANASRHFLRLQVQGAPDTTGTNGCWINGVAGATADYHSLFIPRGSLYESSIEVGTGAVSIICSAASMSVFGRQG